MTSVFRTFCLPFVPGSANSHVALEAAPGPPHHPRLHLQRVPSSFWPVCLLVYSIRPRYVVNSCNHPNAWHAPFRWVITVLMCVHLQATPRTPGRRATTSGKTARLRMPTATSTERDRTSLPAPDPFHHVEPMSNSTFFLLRCL